MEDRKINKNVLYAVVLGMLVLGVGAFVASRGSLGPVVGNKMGAGKEVPPEGQRKGPDFSNLDYASVATKLNLTEEAVKAALTVESGKRLDLEEAATTLGVSVADLRTAMGIPEMKDAPRPNGGNMPTPASD